MMFFKGNTTAFDALKSQLPSDYGTPTQNVFTTQFFLVFFISVVLIKLLICFIFEKIEKPFLITLPVFFLTIKSIYLTCSVKYIYFNLYSF